MRNLDRGHLVADVLTRARRTARSLLGQRRGNVLPVFALTVPVLVLLIGGVIDFSMALTSKTNLQDAADAAALAVAAAVAQNPNTTESALQTVALTVLQKDYDGGSTATIGSFHVCAPVQNDCKSGSTTLAMDTVTLTASSPAPCVMASVVPMICSGSNSTQTVRASTTTVIGFGATIQLNVAMDSSASMIVGATPNDVTLISNWTAVPQNWNTIKPSDPAPGYSNGTGDNPPCAFACHDVGGSTTSADILTGLNNAHTAGATTRFDVMTSAAQQLITHVQNLASNSTALAKNTYIFNIYSFDTAVHQYGSANMGYSAASTAVSTVSPGLDTYLNNAMTTLTTDVGANGNGSSTASPLKFVILVTDGLQSDRNNNWGGSWQYDSAWSYSPTYEHGYAAPIDTTKCTAMKNNGVVLAVLETPYVPLTGQSPNVQPYEKTVRHTIYPNGANTSSAISMALSNCASSGYYFQATNSSQIATGFLTLTDKFLSKSAYISQ